MKKRICIAIEEELLEELDEAVEKDKRNTRTEAILYAIRTYLDAVEEIRGNKS